jgi:hypothetical protein
MDVTRIRLPTRVNEEDVGYPDQMRAESDVGTEQKLTVGQRLLVALPSIKREKDRRPIGDWMRSTFLKPEDPAVTKQKQEKAAPLRVDELEATIKRADDKERAIGLIAGPIGAAIGFMVVHTLVANDPPQFLKGGLLNKLYVNPSQYDEVLLVLLGLSLLIVVFSLLRKRLFVGLATALYGVTIFNLHYWGFGIPFAICGAWYIVRAYRFHRDLKLATGDIAPRAGLGANGGSVRAANKRYTPKASNVRPRRAS